MFQGISGSQARSIGLIGTAIVLMAVIWFAFSGGSEESEITGCVGETRTFVPGETITESCTFNGDVYSSSTIGFTIGADDVTIDGNGYSLIGPGEESGEEGIHCEGHRNIAIKDLHIDYYFGIFLKDVTESEVTSCTISYDYGSGIWLWSSSRNKVSGNNVGPGTGGHGILMWDSSENTISENNVRTVAGGGIFLEEKSNDNRLDSNYVCGNKRGDIFVDADSGGNTGSDNTFDSLNSSFEAENPKPCPE
jgi:parallel beta-helix repeat protein